MLLPKASSLLMFLDGTTKYCLKSTSDTNVHIPGITTHGLATTATINIAIVLNCNYTIHKNVQVITHSGILI